MGLLRNRLERLLGGWAKRARRALAEQASTVLGDTETVMAVGLGTTAIDGKAIADVERGLGPLGVGGGLATRQDVAFVATAHQLYLAPLTQIKMIQELIAIPESARCSLSPAHRLLTIDCFDPEDLSQRIASLDFELKLEADVSALEAHVSERHPGVERLARSRRASAGLRRPAAVRP